LRAPLGAKIWTKKSRSLLRSLVVKRRFAPYAGARAEGALCAVIGGRSEIA
jgi:hypothetical protein